ncbi:unnamed protein product [Pocillopora meandrina]|uniref:Death domain-containing protein n=1 Tax=Pocillopora meandrina TaxID=46732 RepID=A0AAU9X608_9CNID|nr:unnamed protein product [Pocillopora meandrina]
MASQCDNTISIGSLFSAFEKSKPEAVEKIAIKLDMEISRVVKNWRHFAKELNVGPDVIESLKWYGTFSPTTNVFDNLEFTKPDLTIGMLKEVFTNIGRNDLKQLLDRVFKLEDDGKKVITALNKVLLSDIALGLDRFGGPTANWEDFAMHEMIGVAKNRGDLQQFGSPLLENPTARIFQHLESKGRHLTLGELYDVLISDSVKRVRTAKRLIDPNVVESSWRSRLVKKVIVPESSLFRKISCDLNRRVPGTGDWKTMAWKLGIPYEDYIGYETREGKPSPTREVLDKVVTVRPMITISDIVQALEKIERRDVIEIFKEVLGMEDLTGAMRDLTVAMPD